MKILLLFVAFVWASGASAMGPWKSDCQGQRACQLGDRSYHVLAPDGWDGKTPLPVLLHFHGWARQGDLVVRHARIAGATRTRGVLLVAPNGLGQSWDFWRSQTADVTFANRVLEDVARRYPVDPARIYVSGYSFGSAMAWRYACQSGTHLAALLAISGTLPQSERCPQTPREVRHVHGLSDTVMDYPFGPDHDRSNAVRLWRDQMGCGAGTAPKAWSVVPFLTLTRTEWRDCATGAVSLDTHPGGHFIPHGWIGWQLDQLLGQLPRYP